ncbi:carboxypeptidase-like regulatory domain-containing protein [Hydrogenophaga sp.]|uniref:carboxypeptidase-like regulatory domain-containing protein n=1 Tax=Hydrogenophaga sp. TaxID=1904254 RepID=UPI002725B6CA|nr:carboxypeptidase-like regulatory domain-containing protein [Hydrogenophaga sp.]MDO9439138.1 carboxypeptidase-like regulatory domain-containing protein [Hydrogenophaga sp.]
MKRMARRVPRSVHHCLLAFLGTSAPWFAVWAQTAPTAPAANGTAPPAYVDRVIEGLPPEPLDDADARAYDREGSPRFLRLETRLGTQPFDAERKTRIGYGIYGLLETPNHGTLTVDGTYAPSDSSGTLTLRQRGMPLSGGWLTSNELGVINAPAPAILRLPARIYLPSAILQGVSTEWENPGRGLQLQASTGEPGRLDFLPANGFRKMPGQRTTFGGQWRLNADEGNPFSNRGLTVAMQHEDARKVSNIDSPMLATNVVDAQSTLLALRHEAADYRIQGQVLTTQASNVAGGRNGFWIDGEWDDGPRKHGVGAYRLDQDLSWANLPLANDLIGAYVRSSWRTRQWSAEGSVDWLDSISGRNGSGVFATGSARWRLNRDHSVGAGASVRSFGSDALSTYGDWRFQNGWGTTGLRLEFMHGNAESDSRWLSWDQEWTVPQSWAFSTSLGTGVYDAYQGRPKESVWNAALSFTAPLSSKASLRGNLSTERSDTGQSRHAINVGANWRIDQRWSMEFNFNRSTGRSRFNPSLDPLAPPLAIVVPTSDRSFYAVLRYELEAGSRNVPLGGKVADGGGRIAGTVYFDGNRSGTQEASEQGVPNVMVYLDNRYAVRTDSQGRFEFPFVASGPRTVSVRGDSLPLPWNVVDQGQTKVDVRLRESVTLTIPVQRNE